MSTLVGGMGSICCLIALVLVFLHLYIYNIFNLQLFLFSLFYNFFNLILKRQTETVNGTSVS